MSTPWCTGQLEPTVKGLSHQSSGTMGSVSDFETFQARTVRKTHSGKDGQYNSGIFNQPPGGHKVPILSSVNEKAPVLGIQTLPFSQTNHIPGCCNGVADSLSRSGPRPGEWSSQVTFIYIALLTIQIVSKQLHNIKIGK